MHHASDIERVSVVGVSPVIVVLPGGVDIIPHHPDVAISITARMFVSLTDAMKHLMDSYLNLSNDLFIYISYLFVYVCLVNELKCNFLHRH